MKNILPSCRSRIAKISASTSQVWKTEYQDPFFVLGETAVHGLNNVLELTLTDLPPVYD